MLQYDQSALKKHAQAAREGLETLINQIDELAKAPFVESIASELRATHGAAQRALKEVGSAELYLQNYDDRINNRTSTRENADVPAQLSPTLTYFPTADA